MTPAEAGAVAGAEFNRRFEAASDEEARISTAFRRVLNAFELHLAGALDADAVRLNIAASNIRAVGLIEEPTRRHAEAWLIEMQGR